MPILCLRAKVRVFIGARVQNNSLIAILLTFSLFLAGGAFYGGYRMGFDKAELTSQVELAKKDTEIATAKAEAAKAAASKPSSQTEKKPFSPSSLTAADLASVDGLSGLSGSALDNALAVFNNVKGACVPCDESARSLGQCYLDLSKLADKKNCENIPTLTNRVIRYAKQGKSIDEIKNYVDFQYPWYPIVATNQPSKGSASAPITIIEYSDFQCPFCRKVVPTIKGLEEKYGNKIRVVFMNQPLAMHKMATPAAKAALAANLQGKFWEYHDALFNTQGLDEAKLVTLAQETGLNVSRWEKDRASAEIDKLVQEDVARAGQFKVTSTPTLFVNGYRIKGAQPQPAFEKIIDAELADL